MSLQKPHNSLLEIAKNWLAGKITEAEKSDFEQWYNSFDDTTLEVTTARNEEEIEGRLHTAIFQKAGIAHPFTVRRLHPFYRITAAAAVILITLLAGFYVFMQPSRQEKIALHNLKNDIQPGGNKALLTLANGRKIVLDNSKNGILANEGDIIIDKKENGRIVYKRQNDASAVTLAYNTLSTARGGQYEVALPDGTLVWLNAASSLTYPTAFTGRERNVVLTGEAYFEVAKNRNMPFRVKSANQVIEVLGTHFNINAYADEPVIKTTLLEGSVRVTKLNSHDQLVLKPGQQATVGPGKNIGLGNANTDDAVAWKNGMFQFRKADLKTVMRQIARWYDVDIEYAGDVKQREFTGGLYRSLTAAQVLDVLSYTKVNFEIEKETGPAARKKIIVTP